MVEDTAMSRPIALVTGASSGIGADLAREAAQDGHDLIMIARRTEPMRALAEELKKSGAESRIIAADFSKSGAAAEVVKELGATAIDTLICNAGLGVIGRFDAADPAKLSEI